MARVLVVDDDPDLVALVERELRGKGHRVVAAGSPEAALRIVEERGAPEVAVLDVSMPGSSGLELLMELRNRPDCQNLPAIFLSARVQPDDVAAGKALGAQYLTKPYIASALLGAIDRSLPEPEAAGSW